MATIATLFLLTGSQAWPVDAACRVGNWGPASIGSALMQKEALGNRGVWGTHAPGNLAYEVRIQIFESQDASPTLTLSRTYKAGRRYYLDPENPERLQNALLKMLRWGQLPVLYKMLQIQGGTLDDAIVRRAIQLFYGPETESRSFIHRYLFRHQPFSTPKMFAQRSRETIRRAVAAASESGLPAALEHFRAFADPLHLAERLGEDIAFDVLNESELRLRSAFAPNFENPAANLQAGIEVLNEVMYLVHNLAYNEVDTKAVTTSVNWRNRRPADRILTHAA